MIRQHFYPKHSIRKRHEHAPPPLDAENHPPPSHSHQSPNHHPSVLHPASSLPHQHCVFI